MNLTFSELCDLIPGWVLLAGLIGAYAFAYGWMIWRSVAKEPQSVLKRTFGER